MLPSARRPFGLRLGVLPAMSDEQTVTIDDLHYDEERQIALVRLGAATVPWHKHTDGRTKTRTNLDGHKGPDSDVDHRED
jgi:putative ATP-grasp target RiPP